MELGCFCQRSLGVAMGCYGFMQKGESALTPSEMAPELSVWNSLPGKIQNIMFFSLFDVCVS